MFLSKTSRGIYYLFFKDCNGKRKAISTGALQKADAIKFRLSVYSHLSGSELHKEVNRIAVSLN